MFPNFGLACWLPGQYWGRGSKPRDLQWKCAKMLLKMQKKSRLRRHISLFWSFMCHFEAQKVRVLKIFACGELLSASISPFRALENTTRLTNRPDNYAASSCYGVDWSLATDFTLIINCTYLTENQFFTNFAHCRHHLFKFVKMGNFCLWQAWFFSKNENETRKSKNHACAAKIIVFIG